MKVCEDCSRFGKVKGKSNVKVVFQETKKPVQKDPEYAFVQNYGMIVKDARERLGLKQEDFAKKINEHKSIVHQVESEHMKPGVDLARKFERALHIKIVEEIKEEESSSNKSKSQVSENFGKFDKNAPVTIGDVINIKRK